MGLLDRLLGRSPRNTPPDYAGVGTTPPWGTPPGGSSRGTPTGAAPGAPENGPLPDEEAVRRYRYLLRTAPPEAIEQAHAEAFAQLTPQQRRQVLEDLARETPEYERAASDDPRYLARMATRAELRSPGLLERVLGPRGWSGGYGGYGPGYGPGYAPGYGGGYGYGGGIGLGGVLGGSLLASVAGSFIGTAIADEIFDHERYASFNDGFAGVDPGSDPGGGIDFDNSTVDTSGVDDRTLADGAYGGDAPQDSLGDFGNGDLGDPGDFGDVGGDFGGGDNSW
jgi:hypothetical protein